VGPYINSQLLARRKWEEKWFLLGDHPEQARGIALGSRGVGVSVSNTGPGRYKWLQKKDGRATSNYGKRATLRDFKGTPKIEASQPGGAQGRKKARLRLEDAQKGKQEKVDYLR